MKYSVDIKPNPELLQNHYEHETLGIFETCEDAGLRVVLRVAKFMNLYLAPAKTVEKAFKKGV